MRQVPPSHYSFSAYMTKERWASVWHQLDEIFTLEPEKVLEVGPGPGLLKVIAREFSVSIVTLDWDHELRPTCVGKAERLPFIENSFDVVVSFQTLEHIPYLKSLDAVAEMARVARQAVVISVPDCRTTWGVDLKLPLIGKKSLSTTPPKPPRRHVYDGQHHWEIGKKGYTEKGVIRDLESKGLRLIRTYRVHENPYHRFFVLCQATHSWSQDDTKRAPSK